MDENKTKKPLARCIKCKRNASINKSKQCELCILKDTSSRYFGQNTHWKKLADLFVLQEKKCAYTGINLYLGGNASLDHIIARANGGENKIENFQWVHNWINLMKGTLTEQEFKLELRDFVLTIIKNCPQLFKNSI